MKTIEIHKNSITHLKTDAVVNAANSSLLEGGGVCGAIFKAAGSDKLAKECAKYKHCHTGSAVITSACDMKNNKYIIHAVGPRYFGGNQNEEKLLYSCYKKSLELAAENGCESIGFPLISAGIFGYPQKEAWEVALRACQDFLNELGDRDFNIVFVSTDRDSVDMGKSILEKQKESVKVECRVLTKYEGCFDKPVSNQYINYLFAQDILYFVEDNPELGLRNYYQILEDKGVISDNSTVESYDVKKADVITTLALMVYAVRAGRFDEGDYYYFVDNGLMSKWMYHLCKLTKYGDQDIKQCNLEKGKSVKILGDEFILVEPKKQ